jgi:polar amino acid transport system permease protein
MTFIEIVSILARGAGFTILVTLACVLTGFLSGLVAALLFRLNIKVLNGFLTFFTYVFRGVPLLVLLFLVFFGFPSVGIKIPPLIAMMLSLGLICGAYLAEVFRGALAAIDPVEIMVAQSMGMSRAQILISIEMPQMLRFSAPGMLNEFTTVLKYSPFAYTVGVPEILKEATSLALTTLRGMEIYLAVGVLYFLIYKVMMEAFLMIERHYMIPGFRKI